jgi:hypothetical protein
MRIRFALIRLSLAAVLAAAALFAFAPAGTAGTSWGNGCGGTFSNSDSCNFVPLASTVTVHADTTVGSFGCPCIPLPVPLGTYTVTVSLVGPTGTVVGCSATSQNAAQCEALAFVPGSWVGQPVRCVVSTTFVGFAFTSTGDYECQS